MSTPPDPVPTAGAADPSSTGPAGRAARRGGQGSTAGARRADPGAGGGARREMGSVGLLCLVGGGLAVFAGGRAWLRVTAERPPPLPDVVLDLTGRDLAPLVTGLGVVGLAGMLGLLATRGRGRAAVAAVIALSGIVVLVEAVRRVGVPGGMRALVDDSGRGGSVPGDAVLAASAYPFWPVLAAVGGLLLAAGGILALLRHRGWPTMSARYDSPTGRAAAREPAAMTPRTDAQVWDALDRGEDPTTRPDRTSP